MASEETPRHRVVGVGGKREVRKVESERTVIIGKGAASPFVGTSKLITSMSQYQVILPDFGLGDRPIVAGLWLVTPGSRVDEGDQLLEVSADAVVIDIPTPIGGTLTEALVSEDEQIEAGQVLAIIEADEGDR